ncbi:hypothetical protein [Methanolapillus millepedarum]|uniref:Uncharacterized protein n=1 Tax=Methanolapillus millepedarum TaxID=3028296 RepID=A0AA96V413_9EURY|nr:hypothetical protein MsAc7_17720 [Methanosarcinaceae archaeon Ac7]
MTKFTKKINGTDYEFEIVPDGKKGSIVFPDGQIIPIIRIMPDTDGKKINKEFWIFEFENDVNFNSAKISGFRLPDSVLKDVHADKRKIGYASAIQKAVETGKPQLINRGSMPENMSPLAGDGEGDIVSFETYIDAAGNVETKWSHNY